MLRHLFLLAALSVGCASAATSFTPDSFGGPFCTSPPFGTAVCSITDQYKQGGVLFQDTAVFSDPPNAFGGINISNQVDLLAPVTGWIVLAGTTLPAVTDWIAVSAGNASPGSLLLTVYDIHGTSLGSAVNPGSGVSTFSVSAAGIRSFTVSTPDSDTFGVQSISVGELTSADVPEPSTVVTLGSSLAIAAVLKRFRRV